MPVFSTTRSGAATSVTRDDLASLPTISGRITDIARLTPQYGASGSVGGQDNRASNITIDGSYFNGTFGLDHGDRRSRRPHGRCADLARSDRAGPGERRAVRRPSGQLHGRQHQLGDAQRREQVHRVGLHPLQKRVVRRRPKAAGQTYNPGTFKTTTTGEWVGGPIIKNKLFFFQSFEKQERLAAAHAVHVKPRRGARGRQHDSRARRPI